MTPRVALLAVLLAPALSAQLYSLAATADGSSLYFVSTLRLKNLNQPFNFKTYVVSQNGVSLFRAREVTAMPRDSPACMVGGFVDYIAAETSSTDSVALLYRASDSGCSYPSNNLMTQVETASGSTNLRGVVRLSSGGRYGIVFLGATARYFDHVSISFLDIQSGAQTPINFTTVFPTSVQQPYSGGRAIANDGTAILATIDGNPTDGIYLSHGYLVKPGADPAPFPIPDSLPLIIDASGSKVLYQKQGLSLLDLRTQTSTLLLPASAFVRPTDVPLYALRMSDDARRLLFLRDGQAHVLDTTTLADQTLTDDPAKITEATISSDGTTIFAVTGFGRLLKINVDDGSQIELIGHTPYLEFPDASNVHLRLTPGSGASFTGGGLSDSVINGTVPYTGSLGNVTVRIGGLTAPMSQLKPNSLSFFVPWELQADAAPYHLVVEVPGDHTPFYYPEAEVFIASPRPQAGAIFRQDWSQTYLGPVNTGEIIHVYALGFGPVSPVVPFGAAAPSAEPFARLAQALTCSNAEILYAGLAPGAVDLIYQIDLRIGPTPGYQQFHCRLGGMDVIFLSLNVTPDTVGHPQVIPRWRGAHGQGRTMKSE